MARTNKSENENSISPRFRSNSQQVRVSYGAVGRLVVKRVVTTVFIVAFALALLYVCFAATLLRFVPTTDGSGIVPVRSTTYEGGNIPNGEILLVSNEEAQGSDIFSNLKQAFVPSSGAMIVETKGGPYGKMSWTEPDIISLDGAPLDAPFPPVMVPANEEINSPMMEVSPLYPEDREEFLSGEYLVECISGDCEPGTMLIVPQGNVFGTVIEKSSQ